MRVHARRRAAALAFLLLTGAGRAYGQSTPAPPTNDDCRLCHGESDAKREAGTSVFVDAQ